MTVQKVSKNKTDVLTYRQDDNNTSTKTLQQRRTGELH